MRGSEGSAASAGRRGPGILAGAAALLVVSSLTSRVLRRTAGETLAGKVVVITGASSGIGRATALECARRGARVVLAARSEGALERVAGEARALGAEVIAVPTDVRDRAQVQQLMDGAVARFGRVDVLFNNAGGWFIDSVAASDEGRTRDLIDLNVMGVLYGVQAAVPVMRRQGSGHIINTASIEGRVGFPFTGVYAGTRAFVEVMTQTLRQELMHVERTGVRVSVVLPITTRTPIFDKVPNIQAGGHGAHMNPPVQEATDVARAVADAIEDYRPVILPYAPIQSLLWLNALLPGLTGRLLALVRVDRHVTPFSHARRGSHREERPIPPMVGKKG